jgi:hypothetical protein
VRRRWPRRCGAPAAYLSTSLVELQALDGGLVFPANGRAQRGVGLEAPVAGELGDGRQVNALAHG